MPPPPRGEHRIYPTLQAAVERFRLSPEQECANPYYLDWIAHHSVRRATEAEAARAGGSPGWTWRFDPGLFQKVAFKNHWRQLRQTRCPMALVRGARSSLVPQEAWLEQQAHAAQGATFHDVTDAAHHLMLDQPLAFTAKIEALCGDWLDGPGSHP